MSFYDTWYEKLSKNNIQRSFSQEHRWQRLGWVIWALQVCGFLSVDLSLGVASLNAP